MAATAGCDKDPEPTSDKSAAAGAAMSPSGSSTPTANNSGVCSAVTGEIQAVQTKVTEAEAIGPPAGHHAVSAQYSAGSAAIYAHITGLQGTAATAAKGVADAMSAIADKYVDSGSKPDKTPLNGAIEQFKAACAGN
jgi:hypothetical protein